MYQPIQVVHTIPSLRNFAGPAIAGRGFLLIALALLSFGLSVPRAFGVNPAPDGGYANGNTAEGTNALFSLTTGADNTANGFDALYSNTTGNYNTATGVDALYFNNADFNTAYGQS